MRLSVFWTLMEEEFGAAYAHSVARGQHLTPLGGRTALVALEDGVPTRTVWLAVCDAMQVPEERRLGRDVHPPRR